MSGAAENEWIAWAGGACPVALSANVQLRFRHGAETQDAHPAYMLRWEHGCDLAAKHEIIAYRVIP